ncbi:hypothetical protein BDC45DRAFT_520726 [Circinella umbellata]|nr:hypothetical protein BDC45DRAFT_520726 [Circinella umbellata]
MNSVSSTITLPTSNDNNNKQTTNSNKNNNLLLSTSVTLVKTQLYQCWLQVYGPLFWIVSAMICLYSSNSRNTTSATSTPHSPVVRHCSYYQHNLHHQVNPLQEKQERQSRRCNNEGENYYDEGKDDDSNVVDNRVSPSSTLQVRHDQQVDNPRLEELTAPQSKKSLRRSFKHHMQSFKGSLNQVVRRSTTRFQRDKKHPNNDSNNINNTDYHCDDNNDYISDESIAIHPLDFGLQSTCSSTSTGTSMTKTKEGKERKRESFISTVTKTKNNPIFNPFRRKTAPEIDFTIITTNDHDNDKKKKNKHKASI